MTTTTSTETFPTPAQDALTAFRAETRQTQENFREREALRFASLTASQARERAGLDRTATKAQAIADLASQSWASTETAQEEARLAEAARRERRVLTLLDETARSFQTAQEEMATTATTATGSWTTPEKVVNAAVNVTRHRVQQHLSEQVQQAILDHGMAPLEAAEAVLKGAAREVISRAKTTSLSSTSMASNLDTEASRNGQAAWVSRMARLVPGMDWLATPGY